MRPEDCGVCGGSRFVQLPRRPRMMVCDAGALSIEVEINRSVARFPCPECSAGDNVPFEKLAIVEVNHEQSARHLSQNYQDAVHSYAAHALMEEMLRRGLVTFELGRVDERRQVRPLRATVGVVSPTHVATLEQRVRQRQYEMASRLVALNEEEIANWGSFYHGREGGSVGKWQAVEWLRTAFKKLKAET